MVVVGVSEHPEPVEATAEAIGRVLDGQEGDPDLAVLFVSAHHRDAVTDIATTVRAALSPGRLIGVTAAGVVGGGREVEDGPALVLWAARLGVVPEPVRLTARATATGAAVQGLPRPPRPGSDHPAAGDEPADGRTMVLLADPFSLPVADILDVLAATPQSLRVVGGLAAAGVAPGGNRLVLDGEVFTDGAVGVLLQDGLGDEGVDTGQGAGKGGYDVVVSQGCRPIGSPMIVTRADNSQVLELAGQPAVARLSQVASQAAPEERALLADGVHLGIVADEHQESFERGDFLVRNVLGADRSSGALLVGTSVDVGTTVQFHIRDAATADEDLRALLAGHRADGALVFTCNGRGRQLFGQPHHDARLVADITTDGAVAGMFCAGEVGPVGPRSFLHGFTASVLLVHG
ncbi:MAG: FIST signal transduction protein [Acidimicrobiales bacterium]